MEEILDKTLSQYGLAVTLVIAGCLGAAWVAVQLFGHDGIVRGFAARVEERLFQYFDRGEQALSQSNLLHAACQSQQAMTLTAVQRTQASILQLTVDAKQFREAGLAACDVVETVVEHLAHQGVSLDVRSQLKVVREALQSVACIRSDA